VEFELPEFGVTVFVGHILSGSNQKNGNLEVTLSADGSLVNCALNKSAMKRGMCLGY
jgi:hypothetical protein